MDEASIDFQVLSLSAAIGFDTIDAATGCLLARDINDELADAVRTHPTRLGGFATLALKDPAAAAIELERCITRLGFCGALVNGTTEGCFSTIHDFSRSLESRRDLSVPSLSSPGSSA